MSVEGKPLTAARRRALEWIAAREPVGMFNVGGPGPSLALIKRLRDDWLVEECGREPGAFGFVRFRLTGAGRRAIETRKP